MGCLVVRYWKIGIKNCPKRKTISGSSRKMGGQNIQNDAFVLTAFHALSIITKGGMDFCLSFHLLVERKSPLSAPMADAMYKRRNFL